MKIFHGTIISLDSADNVYSWLVEEEGKIAYAGDSLPDSYKGKEPVTELGERVLIPSFGDAHLHFSNLAMFQFDVREARNIREIQEMIGSLLTGKRQKVLVGFGISRHSLKEKRLISRTELDEISSSIPLAIVCYDGHSAVCNTVMMNRFPEKIRELRGFFKDEGHLFNEAFQQGTDYIASQISPLELVRSIISAYDDLAEKGIGMIHPVEGVGFPGDLDVTIASLIARARAHRDNFQTRLFFQTRQVEKVLKRKLPRIGGCFDTALDGCFGACDAALHEPYANDESNKGIFFQSEEEVFRFVREANRAGLQIQMHAIGDAAVTRAVKAIEAALKDYPREDHRHTIIHACLIQPEYLETISRLGIGITNQPAFFISPLEPVEYLEEILGKMRVQASSPLRKILEHSIHLSGGSDGPVTIPDPIEGIYGACNHPYDDKQSLTINEALKMYTVEVAHGSFDEKERGTLEKGKIADMVILNRNPLEMDRKELRSLKVEKLYLGGKEYRKGMSILSMLWHSFWGNFKSKLPQQKQL